MEDISVLVFPLFYHEESREGKRAVFNLRDFRQIFPDKTKSPERHYFRSGHNLNVCV